MSEYESPLPEALLNVPPATIVAQAQSESSIQVIWGYTGGQTSETRIKWLIEETIIGQIDLPIGAVRYTIDGLRPDTRYRVRAHGLKENQESAASREAQASTLPATSKPGSPTNLTAVPTRNSMALTWTRVANASSYKIDYGIEPNGPTTRAVRYRVYLNEVLVMLVNEPVASIVHLQSHTDYRVEVRAFNAAGVSEPSAIRFRTRVRAPTQLRFSHRNGLCRLGWDPVFKKHPAHEISINGQVFNTVPGQWGYNFKLADVSPGPVPHHLMFAVHARLDEDISDIALLEYTVADDVPPSRPETPTVSDITDNGATVNWVPSSDNVGVTGYEVVLNGLLVFRSPDTHFTFTQLTSGAYHWVFVRARDKDGNISAGSRPIAFKTAGSAPSPRPSPPEASITVLTSTSARLDWKYEDDIPGTGVRILINEAHFKDVLLLNNIVLKNLIPNTEYSISVSTFDLYGQLSEPTLLIHEPRDLALPSLPGNLRIANATADSVTLTWNESIDDIGIHEYVIYNNHEYFDSTPLTHYTAVDLLPGTYSFDVCAIDLSGNASDSATLAINIEGPQSSGPTRFRFTQTGPIPTLEWDAPEDLDVVIRYDIVLIGPQGTELPYQTSRTFLRPVLLPRSRYSVSVTAIHPTGRSLPLNDEFTTN